MAQHCRHIYSIFHRRRRHRYYYGIILFVSLPHGATQSMVTEHSNAMASRPSVCPSVCDIEILWSYIYSYS